MKKLTATILSALALTVLLPAGTAVLHAENTPILPANADESVRSELISPTSYEEHLPLVSPSSVSVTGGYTAIADGNTLYLYDRAENAYYSYEHTNPITKIELTEEGTLYFLSSLRLYGLSIANLKANEEAELLSVCSDFTVQQGTPYYYDNAQTLLSLSGKNIPLPYALQNTSPLAQANGLLYCVCKNTANELFTVYAVNPQTDSVTPIANFPEALLSLAIANNQLCAITESGNFYAYALSELSGNEATLPTPIAQDMGNYRAISAHGDNVYAVKGATIREYATEQASFTGYEIGTSSSLPNRLHGASDLFLAETKLFIADTNNDRISVYDTETSTFTSSLETDVSVSSLASYGETLLVSSSSQAILYDISEKRYGTELLRVSEVNGNIVGTASVYNRYYLLTDENYCYTLSKEEGMWRYTETQKNTVSLRAVSFTADVFGSLYAVYDNGKLYRFTEQEFLTPNASGTKLLDGLQKVQKMSLDYDTNLYLLSEGALIKYTLQEGSYTETECYSPSHNLVYDKTPTITSFTFGVRNEYAYCLYEGDYLIKTDELQIPTVSPIPVGNAKAILFEQEVQSLSAAQITAGAILIEFDANALLSAEVFPYTAFTRAQTALTVVTLGEENGYTMISAKNEQSGEFKTYLVRSEDCTSLPENAYYTDYQANIKTGYLTNAVSLYKYPYLTDILTVAELPRGAIIKILGETILFDHTYYFVEAETETGIKTGYIPKNFVSSFENESPKAETVFIGEEGVNTDAVWRVAYLLLGTALICILVDFLLLRKRKNND